MESHASEVLLLELLDFVWDDQFIVATFLSLYMMTILIEIHKNTIFKDAKSVSFD